MKTYTYEQIKVEQEESFTTILTAEQVNMFREITGDSNPLHTDSVYAQSKGFPDMVVYGMLSASYLSTLAGMYLPGMFSLIHEIDVKFPKPILLDGKAIKIVGKVIEKMDLYKRITLKVRITNTENEILVRGTMKIGVMDDE
jgi:acyl dehydratase